MILAVDAGNTRVKMVLVGPRRVVPLSAVETDVLLNDSRAVRRWLATEGSRVVRAEGVALCSVAPALDRPLSSALRGATGKPVLIIRHTCRFPFRLGVVDPVKLGADRLAAAAGAVSKPTSSAVIVDVGSALTVDLVKNGEFRGGLIMAGPGLSLWALGRYARRLPDVELPRSTSCIASRFDDTVPSMILGARTAVRGAVIEGIRVLRRSCGTAPTVFVTGGAAHILGTHLPRAWRRDPYLVARGLYRLWVLNPVNGTRGPGFPGGSSPERRTGTGAKPVELPSIRRGPKRSGSGSGQKKA
jgi:type III pantothenate kinase